MCKKEATETKSTVKTAKLVLQVMSALDEEFAITLENEEFCSRLVRKKFRYNKA